MPLDMAELKSVLDVKQPYWVVRGFEFRNGRQWQQNAVVSIGGKGVVFERNLIREPEVRSVSLQIGDFGFDDDVMVVEGNYGPSPPAPSASAPPVIRGRLPREAGHPAEARSPAR